MGVFVAGVPSSLARRTPFFARSPSPSPFTPATQAINSFERDDQVNAERIPHFESLVRQLQILLKLMGNVRNKNSFMYLSQKSGHLLYLLGNFKKLLLRYLLRYNSL